MTQLCKAVALKLAETSVNRKVTQLRPTKGLWERREAEAAEAWDAARCPTAALFGIAYGTSHIASIDLENRVAGTELDW
jgi:hypothetical protein